MSRFYRPELDLLRLFAFWSVFVTHGPRLVVTGSRSWQSLASLYNSLANSSVYGLCLFFFLSSYLITELLLREQAKTGTTHLKWFYVRRVLRIWPLYYLAVGLALLLVPRIFPENRLSVQQALFLLCLVGYFGGTFRGNPFGVLWSISVEELFYAVWPLLAKGGRKGLERWCWLLIPLSLAVGIVQFDLWRNPLAHFVFFASGALVALRWSSQHSAISRAKRLLWFVGGVTSWAFVPWLYVTLPPLLVNSASFAMVDLGCFLLFRSVWALPLPPHWFTNALLYLGRISYGLYVFHVLCYRLVERWLLPHGNGTSASRMLAIQLGTLALTISVASLSYQVWEKPFLRLKEQFAFVRSRAA